MTFEAEQILANGITIKFVVICGTLTREDTTIQAAEALWVKSDNEPTYRIAQSLVYQYIEENRLEELYTLRAGLVEPFLIQENEVIHLPFITTLKLRAEAWTKAEPFLSGLSHS